MASRGRKSTAELTTATPDMGVLSVVRRPDAPLDLTPDEAEVWSETVDALPADWFPRETWPLLRQFCRHTITARKVALLIDQATSRKDVDVIELRELMAMQAKETSALKALSASMRLSQQASYSARGAGGEKSRRTTVKRPWE